MIDIDTIKELLDLDLRQKKINQEIIFATVVMQLSLLITLIR